MKQYLDLLKNIKEKGTHKSAARSGMPGTTSLFGYQFRHNLADGFPLLTTKKLSFKNIVIELLWFLSGDTNIKFLIDNGCNIWNEDSYNFYLKRCKDLKLSDPLDFDQFIENVKAGNTGGTKKLADTGYKYGDCGYQYGKVWRSWNGINSDIIKIETGDLSKEQIDDFKKELEKIDHGTAIVSASTNFEFIVKGVDQIKNLINGLIKNPESRRHLVTAIDPAHDTDLALYWCHCMMQFNCRPTGDDIFEIAGVMYDDWKGRKDITKEELWEMGYPKYYLDCQLYQRSADVFLGVPYNIASYALLTEILARICNMVPGEFIHTFGDVHIYDNHIDQVNEQLSREPKNLPVLCFDNSFNNHIVQWREGDVFNTSEMISCLQLEWFNLLNYNPDPSIKAKLSTGLK